MLMNSHSIPGKVLHIHNGNLTFCAFNLDLFHGQGLLVPLNRFVVYVGHRHGFVVDFGLTLRRWRLGGGCRCGCLGLNGESGPGPQASVVREAEHGVRVGGLDGVVSGLLHCVHSYCRLDSALHRQVGKDDWGRLSGTVRRCWRRFH